jgi:rhodanese-related sulfurtransferase
MNTRVILTIIFISLGSIAAILPKQNTSSIQLDADELLRDIKLRTHLVSTDELADLLINHDPSLLLIDVRDSMEYSKYHLPGAINIPLKELLDEKWTPYIDQISKNNILYSNGTILSSEAGIICRQLGFKNNFVLEGGLNAWFATIIQPQHPGSMATSEELDQYDRRKAASIYFTGSSGATDQSSAPALPPVPRKKKKRVQGGCS